MPGLPPGLPPPPRAERPPWAEGATIEEEVLRAEAELLRREVEIRRNAVDLDLLRATTSSSLGGGPSRS
eukprot:13968576-Alexandrium_andersonii.AAC.1